MSEKTLVEAPPEKLIVELYYILSPANVAVTPLKEDEGIELRQQYNETSNSEMCATCKV